MALLQSPCNLLLKLSWEILIPIKRLEVSVVTFANKFVDIGDDLGGDTTPKTPLSVYTLSDHAIKIKMVVSTIDRCATYQCLQNQDWNLSVSTQLPNRSSPLAILIFCSLHSLFWQPARPVDACSIFALESRFLEVVVIFLDLPNR
jgi:hypothetical protein